MKINILLIAFWGIVLLSCSERENNSVGASITEKVCENRSDTSEYLYFSCDHYDFGKVDKKKLSCIQFDVMMKNMGETPIQIYKVDASCGCLSATFDKKPILPLDSSLLTVKINTEFVLGHFSKVLFVNYSGEHGVKLIRVVGEII